MAATRAVHSQKVAKHVPVLQLTIRRASRTFQNNPLQHILPAHHRGGEKTLDCARVCNHMHVSECALKAFGIFQKDHGHYVHLARHTHAQHGCDSGIEQGAVGELEEQEQLVAGFVAQGALLLNIAKVPPPAQQHVRTLYAVQICRTAWRQQGEVHMHGEHYTAIAAVFDRGGTANNRIMHYQWRHHKIRIFEKTKMMSCAELHTYPAARHYCIYAITSLLASRCLDVL
jgi:hypothetical protein